MTDDSSQNWLDEQLRDVALPPGLTDRLRRLVLASDADLDEALRGVRLPVGLLTRLRNAVEAEQLEERLDDRLRHVPTPAGLTDRLKQIANPTEELIDTVMRSVPAPDDLLERLRAIPADMALDAEVADVPVPVGLADRLAQPVNDAALRDVSLPRGVLRPSRRRRQSLWSMTLAASLVFMIVGSYVLAVVGMIADAYPQPEPKMVTIPGGQFELTAGLAAAPVELESPRPSLFALPTEPLAFDPSPPLVSAPPSNQGPFAELLAPFGDPATVTADLLELRYDILGQNPDQAGDELPSLTTIPRPRPRGVEPPLTPGFDRKFLLTRRTSPLVTFPPPVPGGNAGSGDDPLRRQQTPLWTATGSFEQAEQSLLAGETPNPRDVYVEDFLAATVDQFVPAARGEVALRTAAGPSPLHRTGAQLVQIGAVAGEPAVGSVPPLCLTVAVDVSASMRNDGHLEQVRQGLRQLTDRLGPQDQLSIVSFSRDAFVAIEAAGPDQREELRRAIDSLRPQGATNLGAGLQRAAAVAIRNRPASDARQLLVIISDGSAPLPRAKAEQLGLLLDEIGAAGVDLLVLDLSLPALGNPALAEVAALADAPLLQGEAVAQLASQLVWRVREAAWETSVVAAEDASLTITFNPAAVAQYRLLGHEAISLAGAAPSESRLLCGQAASALYEVWLWPNDEHQVATAELVWSDPASGQQRRLRQPISRLQFAPSFAESPLSLQAAALAAETAEVLRGSPLAGNLAGSLDEVWRLAEEANPRLKLQASHLRLRRLLEAAVLPANHRQGGN